MESGGSREVELSNQGENYAEYWNNVRLYLHVVVSDGGCWKPCVVIYIQNMGSSLSKVVKIKGMLLLQKGTAYVALKKRIKLISKVYTEVAAVGFSY